MARTKTIKVKPIKAKRTTLSLDLPWVKTPVTTQQKRPSPELSLSPISPPAPRISVAAILAVTRQPLSLSIDVPRLRSPVIAAPQTSCFRSTYNALKSAALSPMKTTDEKMIQDRKV